MSIIVLHPNKLCYHDITSSDYRPLEEGSIHTYLYQWLDTLWARECKENGLYELDCIHGKDCKKINNCDCTSLEKCNSNDRKREAETKKFRSTIHHNVRRRKGYQEQEQHQVQKMQQPQEDHKERTSAYDIFEDFAEDYFRQ